MEENDAYELFCSERVGSDKYTNRAQQSFHNHTKDKECATEPLEFVDQASQAATSILWDAYVSTTEHVPNQNFLFENPEDQQLIQG